MNALSPFVLFFILCKAAMCDRIGAQDKFPSKDNKVYLILQNGSAPCCSEERSATGALSRPGSNPGEEPPLLKSRPQESEKTPLGC